MADARRLGALGVWTTVDTMPAGAAAELCGQLEAWGYDALWLPEAAYGK